MKVKIALYLSITSLVVAVSLFALYLKDRRTLLASFRSDDVVIAVVNQRQQVLLLESRVTELEKRKLSPINQAFLDPPSKAVRDLPNF